MKLAHFILIGSYGSTVENKAENINNACTGWAKAAMDCGLPNIERKINNYQHRFTKIVRDAVWHHKTNKKCAAVGSLSRNRRTDAIGSLSDQFFISDDMHFNSMFHKLDNLNIDTAPDNFPLIDLKQVGQAPPRRNRFKGAQNIQGRSEGKASSGNENRLEKSCRSGFRSLWKMADLQNCPKLEKWKRRTAFLQGQIEKFYKLCRKFESDKKQRAVEQRKSEMIEIPGMGLVHPDDLGSGFERCREFSKNSKSLKTLKRCR